MLRKLVLTILFFNIVSLPFAFAESIVGAGPKSQPIIINGDTVEYSTDAQEVTASGNVEIIYGGSKLTCQKLTVNTQTKQGVASGNARLEDPQGIVEGEQLIYNFETHTGSIVNAQFRANPYFGKVKNLDKESETEFVARYGYMTTCSFDHPHYKIASKQINVIPGQAIQAKDNCFYLGGFPLLYMPRFNRTFEKPLMHVSVLPGKRKLWGPYLLSVWRVNVNDNVDGRLYLDYRNKLGWAEGFGANYRTANTGKGDFKFYYTYENKDPDDNVNDGYNRYLLRYRHKWAIDEQTDFMSEIVKVRDDKRKYFNTEDGFLKDYFFREFEKDQEPLTYALFHHSFNYSSLNILVQKRINHWYTYDEKLPEITYSLPSLKIGESPFYFDSNSTLTTFNKRSTATSFPDNEVKVTRFNSDNKLSLPLKLAFIEFAPFVKLGETVYDKSADGSSLPARTVFYGGADASTKFYRIYNVNTDFMGLDINKLRHIITPSIKYSYNIRPTIAAIKLKQIDSIDSLTSNNSAALELVNKLQTKRKDEKGKEYSVDLAEFDINTTYAFGPRMFYGTTRTIENDEYVYETNVPELYKRSGSFQDFLFKLKLLPYSWLRIEADATYKHSGAPTDLDYDNYNHFSKADYDIIFQFSPERSFGLGQRYERKQGNQITAEFKWRLNPKWKFGIYQRYNLRTYGDQSTVGDPVTRKGSLEQEFTLTRDLHCWEVDLTLNNKVNEGSTIFVVFRLKAFPENEFGFDQSYNSPKTGAQ